MQTGGVEDMEFPGVLKKEHVEILGINLKRSGISRVCSRKIHVEFPWVLFLTLEFPRGATQFWRISRGESLLSLEFEVKVTNLKIPGDSFRKVYPPPPLFGFFLEYQNIGSSVPAKLL